MADTLAVDVQAKIGWSFQEALELSTIIDASQLEYKRAHVDGTSTNQADKLWHDERTVSASSNDDLDLTALSTSAFDATLVTDFAAIKCVFVVNLNTASGDTLRVGGAGASAFSAPFQNDDAAVVEVPEDSALLLTNRASGWSVSDGTADTLRIHNPSANAIVYRVVIVGTSA